MNKSCIALVGAVIRQAISDLKLLDAINRVSIKAGRDAYRFLSGKGLESWCSRVGLDANCIRRQINLASYAKKIDLLQNPWSKKAYWY